MRRFSDAPLQYRLYNFAVTKSSAAFAGVIIDTWGSFACFGTGAFVALAIPVLAILTYPMMKKQVG